MLLPILSGEYTAWSRGWIGVGCSMRVILAHTALGQQSVNTPPVLEVFLCRHSSVKGYCLTISPTTQRTTKFSAAGAAW